MAQSHTWNFYLTAGRTWGGPRISGASITAYSTKSGSTVLKALTTNASGYATYTLTGSSINPASYYWRVNVGNIFGDYYNGKNVVGGGDQSGYYGIPSTTYNTSGAAHMSPTFSSSYVNATGTVTLYLFVVGNNVTISSTKFVTHFDVLALVPPIEAYLSSGTTRMELNRCITDAQMRDYQDRGAFKNSVMFDGRPDLVIRDNFQEFSSFLSGTSAAPTLSTTSLSFAYNATAEQTVTVTVPTNFDMTYRLTGTYSAYFTVYVSQTNTTTYHLNVYPTSSNSSGKVRTASLIVGVSVADSNTWFGGDTTTATVAITQKYYQSSGTSGSTGGGGTGGGGSQT